MGSRAESRHPGENPMCEPKAATAVTFARRATSEKVQDPMEKSSTREDADTQLCGPKNVDAVGPVHG